VTAQFELLDFPLTERGDLRCAIDVRGARLYHPHVWIDSRGFRLDEGGAPVVYVAYDLRIRRKPSTFDTVAAPAAQPDATSRSTPQLPPAKARYGHTDDTLALEILTQRFKVTLPIRKSELAAYQSKCPRWATDWCREKGNQERMEGHGKFDRMRRRMRDAMHRVLAVNTID
jgi:hypothetical protein